MSIPTKNESLSDHFAPIVREHSEDVDLWQTFCTQSVLDMIDISLTKSKAIPGKIIPTLDLVISGSLTLE